MNLGELQSELRHFAAERDWQPFHTPKNLSMALMVEAAALAELFQWHTPDESTRAHEDAATKARIGEEVADVLLYLLQLAEHCRVDVQKAVRAKLAKNALKYPAKRVIGHFSPMHTARAGTQVLLDYENVQPSDAELRALVPGANRLLVFHGPHQRDAETRFVSFGSSVTVVSVSKPGKNALDFHLSFYLGNITSRDPGATIVIVSNDKGYDPMLKHARAQGYDVRRQTHGKDRPVASKAVGQQIKTTKTPVAKPAAADNATAAPVRKTVSGTKTGTRPAPALATKTSPRPEAVRSTQAAAATPVLPSPVDLVSAADIERITDALLIADGGRPKQMAALRRLLKLLLGAETGDPSIEHALELLISAGVVAVGARSSVEYPALGRD